MFSLILSGLVATKLGAFSPRVESNDYIPGEILVKFKPGTPAFLINQLHRENKGVIKEKIAGIGVQVVKFEKSEVLSKVATYSHNPNIEYAEPNYLAKALVIPDDFYFDRQWGMNNTGQTGGTIDADIDVPEAWNLATGSGEIKIAILDSGIDQDHEDLASKIVANEDFADTGAVDDFYGHGTHVAGIAAATTNNSIGVAGVGYHLALMNVKVLDDNGYGVYSWVTKGIIWATDNGAKVINMSLGGSQKSRTLEEAVNYAWGKGVVLVAAAGNSDNPSPTYPAKYENCIAVASTDHNDRKASDSSYGDWVDIAAPGVKIFSTFPNHPYAIGKALNYDYGSGTSMATPHVAGIAGLVWATYGTSQQAVRQRIEQTAEAISGTGSYWIWGRVNACNAVGGSCLEEPSPTPSPSPTSTPSPTPEPTPNQCASCFRGICDSKCHPIKDGPGCPDCQ